MMQKRSSKYAMPRWFVSRRCGFEAGASSGKLVIINSRHHGSATLERISLEETPLESRIEGDAPSPAETTRKLLIQHNLTGCKTTFVADKVTATCFAMVPSMTKHDSEGAILLQARKLLDWEGSNPIMGHMDSEFARDRIGSVVALADWQSVNPWCKLIEGSGGITEDITVRACAYQALAKHQNWKKEHRVVLVADIGASSARFYILENEKVRFTRSVPTGGDDITKALTTEVSTDEGPVRMNTVLAEKLKVTGQLKSNLSGKFSDQVSSSESNTESNSGTHSQKWRQQMEMVVRPIVERIASEVTRSMQFFKENTGKTVEAVLITGGASRLQPLLDQLHTKVSIPIRNLDPFVGLEFCDDDVRKFAQKHNDRLTVAVGLALAKRPEISLIPGYLRASRRFANYTMPAVAALLIFGFLPLLLLGVMQSVTIQRLKHDNEKQARIISTDTSGKNKLAALRTDLDRTRNVKQALDSLLRRHPVWAGVLNSLAHSMPKNVVLTELSTKSDKHGHRTLILEGQVLENDDGFDGAVSALLTKLGSSVFFKQVSMAHADATPADKVLGTFEVNCQLTY